MAFNLNTSRESVWPAHLSEPIRHPTLRRHASIRLPRKVQAILGVVATIHGITATSILGGSQTRTYVAARRDAAQRLHAEGFSLTEIGGYLGRHHTSILSLIGRKGVRSVVEPEISNAPDYSGEWV